MRRKQLFIAALITAFALTGCSNNSDDDRILSDGDGHIKEVTNFSQFNETEIPTEKPTEKQTEPPTEKPTEPPTEKPTEPPTEAPKETEPPEEKHFEDYDFSDFRILQAVFKYKGGLGAIPYTNTVEQDYDNKTRTQTVLTEDGSVQVVFKADTTSGETNKTLEITYSSDELYDEVKGILLSFENGLNEYNIERFMEGYYNGTENAPYIGLADCVVEGNADTAHIILTKQSVSEGEVPFWVGAATADLGTITGSDKISGQLSSNEELFKKIFESLEFAKVELKGSETSGYRVVTNEKGDVLETSSGFSSSYEASNGTAYSAYVSDSNKLVIERSTGSSLSQDQIRSIAGYIYQEFYEGNITGSIDLSSGVYEGDRFKVETTDGGYRITIG